MTSTSLWIGLASLVIAVLALIVEFMRARDEHVAGFNILAFFASLGTAVFIFLWQRNAWIALIASGLSSMARSMTSSKLEFVGEGVRPPEPVQLLLSRVARRDA